VTTYQTASDDAPPVGNPRFVHNMRALWRCDPGLALRVDAVLDEERFAPEPARSGAMTIRVPAPDGNAVYLHSRYDPGAEAERLASAVAIEGKFCFVVSGLGLGYHVAALCRRLRGDAVVVVCEPCIEMIATALCCCDLAAEIESRRVLFLTDTDKGRLHDLLRPFGTLMMLGAKFVRHAPSVRLNEAAHAAMTEAIAEFVTYTRMTLMTLVSNAKVTCQNIAMNLVHYVQTPPIDMLRDRFAGNPAVVVSAGPSLSKNIDRLAALKGRAVLCAVQTAIKPLMSRGIVPDFVTSLDFHMMSRKFFEQAGDLSKVHLVAEPKATWQVTDHYPGPMSLLFNTWAQLVVGDELARRDGLKAGATVAHLAFYLAVYMGCDPIIFVGQDLAFTGHVFYIPGVDIHQSWHGEINRFHTMEMKEWERIARNKPILRRVRSVDGHELYTDELLFTYLEQFESDIAQAPRRVIDATEGGARIRGTEAMTLAEAAERFCAAPIDPERFAYRSSTRWRDRSRLPATREELTRRVSELDGVLAMCDELLSLFDELEGLTGDPPAFNRRIVRVDELRSRINRESRAYQIVNAATQLAEFRRYSADRRLGADGLEGGERAKRQIERDRDFISGVRDGAAEVKTVLWEALDRVRRAEDEA